jgi:hypothetical protein
LRSTEVYDPRTGRFALGPRLRDGRYKLAGGAAALPDGRVAVAGGGPGLEVLDLVTGTSREIGDRHGVASFSTVGVLGDTDAGSLLVLGGYDEGIRLTRTRQLVPLADL